MVGSTLDGLKTALAKAGVADNRWAIAYRKKDLGPVDDRQCLYENGTAWIVSYVERNNWTEIARFQSQNDAIRFFWWRLTNAPTPFD